MKLYFKDYTEFIDPDIRYAYRKAYKVLRRFNGGSTFSREDTRYHMFDCLDYSKTQILRDLERSENVMGSF